MHVIDSLSGSGGAEHGMVREIVRFSEETESLVVRLFANDTLEPTLSDRGIDVVSLGLNSSHAAWNWPRGVKALGEVIEMFQPGVLHSSLFSSNVVAQVAARRAETRILSTFTLSGDPRLLRRYQPGAHTRRAAALRKIAGLAARSELVRFRALTVDARDTNCRLLGVDPSRVDVIPRGIPDTFRRDPMKTRAELGLPDDVPILLNVGRQTAQKGHVSLVEAFELVRGQVDSHLVILGRKGDATPQLNRAIADSGLASHVTVIDYTPDVAHFMACASVFVFSSYMEGLGTAVIEALASDLPVVAFDIPPVREATNQGEFASLVPVGDVAALATEISTVLSASFQGNRATASSWARSTYSIDAVSSQVESILAHLAST